MIKPDLDKIITFDLETSLKIEGDTCSYIQYSYARATRILEKSGMSPDFNDCLSNLTNFLEILFEKGSHFCCFTECFGVYLRF